jgi:hypothetical protein
MNISKLHLAKEDLSRKHVSKKSQILTQQNLASEEGDEKPIDLR